MYMVHITERSEVTRSPQRASAVASTLRRSRRRAAEPRARQHTILTFYKALKTFLTLQKALKTRLTLHEGSKTLLITESFAILLCQARWDEFTDVNLELHKSNIMGCMEGFGMGANIEVYGPPSHGLTRRLNGHRAKCVALPLPPGTAVRARGW